jgi:hypothetical protein
MGRINITKSQEWLGAIAAMQQIDKSFAAALRKYIKAMAEPEWRKAVSGRSRTNLERRVISATTTVAVSSSNVTVASGAKGRPLSGGLSMSQAAPAVEFGAIRYKQFGPRRRKGPFYQAADSMFPRLAALFTQTIVKTMALALDGKQS